MRHTLPPHNTAKCRIGLESVKGEALPSRVETGTHVRSDRPILATPAPVETGGAHAIVER